MSAQVLNVFCSGFLLPPCAGVLDLLQSAAHRGFDFPSSVDLCWLSRYRKTSVAPAPAVLSWILIILCVSVSGNKQEVRRFRDGRLRRHHRRRERGIRRHQRCRRDTGQKAESGWVSHSRCFTLRTAASLKHQPKHYKLKWWCFWSVFHRNEEAAEGIRRSCVQPGNETGGLSVSNTVLCTDTGCCWEK